MPVRLRIVFVCVSAAILLSIGGCGDSERQSASAPDDPLSIPVDSALLASLPSGTSEATLREGERLFRLCTACHGLEAGGTQLGPSLTDDRWIHVDGQVGEIADLIRAGVSSPREFPIPMPPMGGDDLTEDEVTTLAIYVRARSLAGG